MGKTNWARSHRKCLHVRRLSPRCLQLWSSTPLQQTFTVVIRVLLFVVCPCSYDVEMTFLIGSKHTHIHKQTHKKIYSAPLLVMDLTASSCNHLLLTTPHLSGASWDSTISMMSIDQRLMNQVCLKLEIINVSSCPGENTQRKSQYYCGCWGKLLTQYSIGQYCRDT